MIDASEVAATEDIPLDSPFVKYVYIYRRFAPNLIKLENKIHVGVRENIGPKVNVKDLVLPVFADHKERSVEEICKMFHSADRQVIANTLSVACKKEILSRVKFGVYVRGPRYHVYGDGK